MHADDAKNYEGPPCEMCTRHMFIGTCTHRPRKSPKPFKFQTDEKFKIVGGVDVWIDVLWQAFEEAHREEITLSLWAEWGLIEEFFIPWIQSLEEYAVFTRIWELDES